MIYEVGPKMEPTKVEVSKNGSHWINVGQLKGRTKAIDLKGKVNKGDRFYYVRLTDNNNKKCKILKKGISVDPYDKTAGADIDAIASLNSIPRGSADSIVENTSPTTLTPNTTQVIANPINLPKNSNIPVAPNESVTPLKYTLFSAEQGTHSYAEFRITLTAKKAQFKNSFSGKAQLVYWGEQDIPPITLSVKRENKYKLVAQLPRGKVSENFVGIKGQYRINLVDSISGKVISNSINVKRQLHHDGSGNADGDGDGHRSLASGGNDCDDESPLRSPSKTEVSDPYDLDEDCNFRTFGTRDEDGDGHIDATSCNFDRSGNAFCGTDCNDKVPNINPNSSEVCDRVDNDCDGLIDEGMTNTFYFDSDGDSFGNNLVTVQACRLQDITKPGSWTSRPNDCDDSDNSKNPAIGCD